MAGMFALMGKRKRERELKRLNSDHETTFSEHVLPAEMERRNAMLKEAIKRENLSRSRSRSRSQSKEKSFGKNGTSSDDDDGDGIFKNSLQQANSLLYLGLVLSFKTTELKLIGPFLSLIGISCVLFKVIECYCPFLRNLSFKRAKLSDKPQAKSGSKPPPSFLIENESRKSSINPPPPRIQLQGPPFNGGKRPSFNPSYIDESSGAEDYSDDSDDFDHPSHSRSRHPIAAPHLNTYDSSIQIAKLKEQLDSKMENNIVEKNESNSSSLISNSSLIGANGKRVCPFERELEMKKARELARAKKAEKAAEVLAMAVPPAASAPVPGTSNGVTNLDLEHEETFYINEYNQDHLIISSTSARQFIEVESNIVDRKETVKKSEEIILDPKTLMSN